jgi:hypothetical protein
VLFLGSSIRGVLAKICGAARRINREYSTAPFSPLLIMARDSDRPSNDSPDLPQGTFALGVVLLILAAGVYLIINGLG